MHTMYIIIDINRRSYKQICLYICSEYVCVCVCNFHIFWKRNNSEFLRKEKKIHM